MLLAATTLEHCFDAQSSLPRLPTVLVLEVSSCQTFLDRSTTIVALAAGLGLSTYKVLYTFFFFVTQVVVCAEQEGLQYSRLLDESIQLIASNKLEIAEQRLVDLVQDSHGGRKPDTWHVLSVLKQQQGRHEDGYGFSRKALNWQDRTIMH